MGITVVIRTRDVEEHFDSLLESLALQTVVPSELAIVNNYSNERRRDSFKEHLIDRSQEFLRDSKIRVKLLSIPDSEFSHAYSTNLGAAASDSDLLCFTNGHSLPISYDWLEHGARHFADSQVAGVSGYFCPHHRNSLFSRVDCALYKFSQKTIVRQNWCSTINGMIRKSLWKSCPFDENLPSMVKGAKRYGLEDYDWSKEMIARSFKIIIDPAFSVYHSHGNPFQELVRNTRGFFTYRKLQKNINSLKRPKAAYSKVFESNQEHITPEAIL